MNPLQTLEWNTGSGERIKFNNIIPLLKTSISIGAKIYIGTDSSMSRDLINFATAICIYGDNSQNRYFFLQTREPKKRFSSLAQRITEEAYRSVSIAELLINKHKIKNYNLELHLDISPLEVNTKTSKFSETLRGYVSGAGFECKIKPNAWASQSVADRHSK